MTQRFDAIVVGGGHNGLVAAHYLIEGGLKVAVLERREVVGGPASVNEFFPGYRGAFTNSPGSLEPMIVRDMRLGDFGLRWVKPDPSVVQPFPDGRAFVAWRDKAKVAEHIAEFSKHDATAYYAFFDWLSEFARTLHVSLFQPPPSLAELTSHLRTPADEEAFAKVMLGSVRDLLDEWLESEEVKAVVGILAVMHNWVGPSTPGTPYMLLQRPLSLASLSVSASDDPRLQPLRGSTGLPLGGMGSITAAMRRSIEARGAVVRTNAAVATIRISGGTATGVVLESGEEIEAPLVLSNVDPKTTLLKLLPAGSLDAEVERRLRNLKMNGNAFKVVLALDGLPRFAAAKSEEDAVRYAACQFRIAPSLDWMEEGWDDAKNGRWPRKPMMWGLTPSVSDPTMAPAGKHLMSVNVFSAPYRLKGADWSSERERFGKHCIEVLSDFVPNLKSIINDVRYYSPVDLERELGLPESHITHGDMTPAHMFSLRPIPGWSDYRTPVKGLYLCGVGTWPGGNVSGIPGHNAGRKVLADLARPLAAAEASIPVSRL